MATTKTETTHGPTYSMARAVGAMAWQKEVLSVNAIVCLTHSSCVEVLGARLCQKHSDIAFIYPCHLRVHVLPRAWCAEPACSTHIWPSRWSASASLI